MTHNPRYRVGVVALALLAVAAFTFSCATTSTSQNDVFFIPNDGKMRIDLKPAKGEPSVVGGIEFWNGAPPRGYRILGIVEASKAPDAEAREVMAQKDDIRKLFDLAFLMKPDVAELARKRGGDAAVFLGVTVAFGRYCAIAKFAVLKFEP